MKTFKEVIEIFQTRDKKESKALKIFGKNFKNELLKDLNIACTIFRDSKLDNVEFKNINLELRNIANCSFENCILKDCCFEGTEFRISKFKNCQFVDSYFRKAEFKGVEFKNCKFLGNCFCKAYFESCKFIDTAIEKSDAADLVQTLLVNSTFSKLDKSIVFNGCFALMNILLPLDTIDELFF